MKKVQLDQVKPYEAPKHFNMVALRLHGQQETGVEDFWVGLSHFLPGGGAEFDATPTEKVYFVLEGEVTVKTEEQELTLRRWESVFIPPNEGREITNRTNLPASMLVVMSKPR